MNPLYQDIAAAFVQSYYLHFDDNEKRSTMASFYDEETSLMSFEGQNLLGRSKIMEKLNCLTFQKIAHSITKVDCQPMFDGGVLVCVLGQLKTDDDPPHTFSQTFVLKPYNEGFYVQHDVFRIAVHDAA
ncbi:probable nuclear transport factor 2 isoform X1 [Limulus polyphemus]|uniref:Nuclear transport factor 2 n=1 Tax=Limulus polyphemus TaxID=6850 RepID=A0ABM1B5F4_LIMPO|nr:probable nuclear transport factor 2 isoform X1 [Limulus polyphemus]